MADAPSIIVDVTIDFGHPIPHDITEGELGRLLTLCLREEGRSGHWLFSIAFVDEPEIIDLHRRFMDLDSPTDILTFPFDEDAPWQGGDIAICVPVAASNATDNDQTLSWELRFLAIHGALHILGWNDLADADRQAMLDRQLDILTNFESS